MYEAKLIQNLDIDNNLILNVRLELSPNLTQGVDKLGKFGINSVGAFVYVAGYNNGVPVINNIKPYVAVPSIEGDETFLKITNDITNFKNGIALDIMKLINRIIKDGEEPLENSTWSSQKITQELALVYSTPVLDEANIIVGLTDEDLNTLYPAANVNDSFYSIVNNIEYTKISASEWKSNSIVQLPVNDFKADAYFVNDLNPAPTSSTDTGTKGEIRYTADYIYLCVATDTWKRSPLETF